MVLPDRIELSTSPLPMECSTTELRQHAREKLNRPQGPVQAGGSCHRPPFGASETAPLLPAKSAEIDVPRRSFRPIRPFSPGSGSRSCRTAGDPVLPPNHASDPPGGSALLMFGEGAALRLDVECLECELTDLGADDLGLAPG